MKDTIQPPDRLSSKPAAGQRGMASILVTLISMIVISLIVLGFATVSRREQRMMLDQQLSAQAFYAAESAVEDARSIIQESLLAGAPLINKDQCLTNNPGGNYPTGVGTVLDAPNEVSYTCLKVDVAPEAAQYDGVSDDYIVVPVKTSQPITRLEITWQPSVAPQGTPSDCPATTNGVFSPQDQWSCGYSVLRTDIVDTSGNLTSAGLANNTLTGFFVPTRVGASGQVSFNGDRGKANVIAGDCGTVNYTVCKANITGLGSSTEFSLRISSLYRTSNVRVIAYQGSDPLTFDGAQAVVDATGKAQDVLRRIQVRLPISIGSRGATPSHAIQSNSALCKRFQVSRTYFNIPGDIVNKDTDNPMCVQKSDGIPPPRPCTQNNDIALTLDLSSSLNSQWQTSRAIATLRQATTQFALNTNISGPANHASLVSFSDNSRTLYPLGSSSLLLAAQGATLSTGSGTANYEKGLTQAGNELSGSQARAGSPKVLVFVTDGAPDDNKDAIRSKAADLKNAGVAIYTVGIDGTTYQTPIQSFDEQLLIDMAGNGGRYAVANSEADLQNIIQDISNDLKCQ